MEKKELELWLAVEPSDLGRIYKSRADGRIKSSPSSSNTTVTLTRPDTDAALVFCMISMYASSVSVKVMRCYV